MSWHGFHIQTLIRVELESFLWASPYFIMTETLNYLPDIRQLHSSTIPHLGSWYWAVGRSQLFLHSSSQKSHSDICWGRVSVVKINSSKLQALTSHTALFISQDTHSYNLASHMILLWFGPEWNYVCTFFLQFVWHGLSNG